ncbi:MAG: hypothetical protein OEU68_19005 [Nitrospira sp.]|nr:hypothetical protein [Nitrospira sp.]MDH4243786.1 hypothetical protein [Nitrospira sp.]MDH4358315.1 hypothetical protein [Nitrospira sp.]MDH5320355.1 hypothetical protein [Nitrospira sp.]
MRAYFTLRRTQYVGVLTCLSLLVGGCSMFSGETKVHKNAKGSVYLKEVADWSFEASHPAVIDHMTMLKVVKGVVTDSASQMPASGSKPMRVFSDEDAAFLAPLLAQSLSQAKPDQIVGFKVSSSAGSGAEPTAGTLYIRNGSFHLTIAPSKDNRASGFVPNSVARLEKAPSFVAMGSSAVTMIIDQQALAKAPMPASEPVAIAGRTVPEQESMAAGQDLQANGFPYSESAALNGDELLNKKLDELRDAREANKLKDSEIATLKKEAARMKKELRQRAEEVKALKATKASAKPAQKKKSAEARKIR